MPYVKRTVVAGDVIEVKKMYTARYGRRGSRAAAVKATEEAQARVNERKLCEVLRWRIEANFRENDFHTVLHYNDKGQSLEKVYGDLRRFLDKLRREYKKRYQKPLKYIAVVETKRLTNPHIHLILPEMDIKIITRLWKEIAGGRVSNMLLDGRGFHADLAEYLMKESRSTAKRNAGEKHKKRYWCSKNLTEPVIKYEVVPAASWKRDPKPKKGYYLYKYEDGSTTMEGVHEVTGYGWMEYIQVRLC